MITFDPSVPATLPPVPAPPAQPTPPARATKPGEERSSELPANAQREYGEKFENLLGRSTTTPKSPQQDNKRWFDIKAAGNTQSWFQNGNTATLKTDRNGLLNGDVLNATRIVGEPSPEEADYLRRNYQLETRLQENGPNGIPVYKDCVYVPKADADVKTPGKTQWYITEKPIDGAATGHPTPQRAAMLRDVAVQMRKPFVPPPPAPPQPKSIEPRPSMPDISNPTREAIPSLPKVSNPSTGLREIKPADVQDPDALPQREKIFKLESLDPSDRRLLLDKYDLKPETVLFKGQIYYLYKPSVDGYRPVLSKEKF